MLSNRFYESCPHSKDTAFCSEDNKLEFQARLSPTRFKFDQMKRSNTLNRHQTCTYQVQVPRQTFQSGVLNLRFNELENLDVFVYTSNNTEIENTNLKLALALINLYFQNQGDKIKQDRKKLVDDNSSEKLLNWISDLILVGWQMCS